MTAFLDPDGSETRLGYDGAGRLAEVAYPNGVTETRAYDAAGRLSELAVQGPEGLLESYAYTRDARGFAVKRVEEDGATTSWAYDAAGRLVRVDYPAGKIQAIRDEQGAAIERVKAATAADEGADQPSGGKAAEPKDNEEEKGVRGSRSTADSGAGDRLADVACAGSGFVIAKGQGNGGGNGAGNGGGNAGGNGGGSDQGGGQGNGNAGGKDKEEGVGQGTGAEADTTETFVPAYTLPVREWVEYQYDAAGNRVRETSDLGVTEYEYDAANRLLAAGDVSFAYDAAGRLTGRLAAGEAVAYGYDVAGRLREVSYEDGAGVAYGYDALGRKVFRQATFWSQPNPKRRGPSENGLKHGKGFEQGQRNGQENRQGHAGTPPGLSQPRLETETTTYLWDGLCVLAEYTDKGAPLAEYYTAGDRVLARRMFGYHDRKEPGAPDLKTNGGLLYYTYDGIVNVSLLTDRLGEPEARYRYDAFGGLLTSATAPYNLYGPFGKEFDPAAGLIYFGARWYDPAVGRFTTPDPLPGRISDPLALNPYLFARANPVNYVDRWGLHIDPPWYNPTAGPDPSNPDWREIEARICLASVEVWYTQEVSRSPSEVVYRHVYRHSHQYQYIDIRSEKRTRPDGFEYWEVVKDIEYTYWRTVDYSEEWETVDLIGPKRQGLVDAAGEAPGSSSPPGAPSREVVVNPLFYPEGLPEEQLPTAWGARQVTSYHIEPGERPEPLEQAEVLSPPVMPVSDEEAYRVLYEFATFVGLVAGGVVLVIGIVGSGPVAAAVVGYAGWLSFGSNVAAAAAMSELDSGSNEEDQMAWLAIGTGLGVAGGMAWRGGSGNVPIAVFLWALGTGLGASQGGSPTSGHQVAPRVPEQ